MELKMFMGGRVKHKPALYLCLCVPHFYAQTYLRFHPEIGGSALAMADSNSAVAIIEDVNDLADARGISIGMTAVHAGLDAELIIAQRSVSNEIACKQDLIHVCHQISPLIEDCSSETQCVLVLDITGSLGLFITLGRLVDKLLALMFPMRFEIKLAASSSFHSARMLAQQQQDSQPFKHLSNVQEAIALSKLPIAALGLDEYQQETFCNWGIHRLGELAALPLDELVSRMGHPARRLHELSRGICPHVFQPLALPELLQDKVVFDTPIDLFESLLFSLSPMLDKLIHRAQEEMTSIASIRLSMGLSNRSVYTRTIQPALPSTSTKLFLKLIHLDLEAHPPATGVTELMLTAVPGPAQKVQLGMFSPQHPDTAHLDVALARIRKIVGADHVGTPVLEDAYSQSSVLLSNFTIKDSSLDGLVSRSPICAKRLSQRDNHIAVRVQNGMPAGFILGNSDYDVIRAYGPWRSIGKWWSNNSWNLEYWDTLAATIPSQQHLHCCLSFNRANKHWSLNGVYD